MTNATWVGADELAGWAAVDTVRALKPLTFTEDVGHEDDSAELGLEIPKVYDREELHARDPIGDAYLAWIKRGGQRWPSTPPFNHWDYWSLS